MLTTHVSLYAVGTQTVVVVPSARWFRADAPRDVVRAWLDDYEQTGRLDLAAGRWAGQLAARLAENGAIRDRRIASTPPAAVQLIGEGRLTSSLFAALEPVLTEAGYALADGAVSTASGDKPALVVVAVEGDDEGLQAVAAEWDRAGVVVVPVLCVGTRLYVGPANVGEVSYRDAAERRTAARWRIRDPLAASSGPDVSSWVTLAPGLRRWAAAGVAARVVDVLDRGQSAYLAHVVEEVRPALACRPGNRVRRAAAAPGVRPTEPGASARRSPHLTGYYRERPQIGRQPSLRGRWTLTERRLATAHEP